MNVDECHDICGYVGFKYAYRNSLKFTVEGEEIIVSDDTWHFFWDKCELYRLHGGQVVTWQKPKLIKFLVRAMGLTRLRYLCLAWKLERISLSSVHVACCTSDTW